MPMPEDELVSLLAYALTRNWHLAPRSRSVDDARVLARAIARQLGLSRVAVMKLPPLQLHSTP